VNPFQSLSVASDSREARRAPQNGFADAHKLAISVCVFNHLRCNSLVDVTQRNRNFRLMGKNPAELRAYGVVCFSVMGYRCPVSY
jgi:hypothetical protein